MKRLLNHDTVVVKYGLQDYKNSVFSLQRLIFSECLTYLKNNVKLCANHMYNTGGPGDTTSVKLLALTSKSVKEPIFFSAGMAIPF